MKKEFGNNTERIRRRLERERFKLDETCCYDYLFQHRNDNNIGQLINQALEKIEEDNKAKLEGVFRNIDFNSDMQLGETSNTLTDNFFSDLKNRRLEFHGRGLHLLKSISKSITRSRYADTLNETIFLINYK